MACWSRLRVMCNCSTISRRLATKDRITYNHSPPTPHPPPKRGSSRSRFRRVLLWTNEDRPEGEAGTYRGKILRALHQAGRVLGSTTFVPSTESMSLGATRGHP